MRGKEVEKKKLSKIKRGRPVFMPSRQMLKVYLSEEEAERVRVRAQAAGISVSAWIRGLVGGALDK